MEKKKKWCRAFKSDHQFNHKHKVAAPTVTS